MELRIVILYSLLLVSTRGSRPFVIDGSTGNKWPESLVVPANEGIDPWKGAEFHPLITSATLEGEHENGANSATVHSATARRDVSAVAAATAATPTGSQRQWSRTKRAAEILGTSVNHQAAISSSSSVLPNSTPETTSSTTQQPVSAVPDSASQASVETSSEPATTVLSTTTTTTTTTEVSTATSTMTSAADLLSPTSTQPPPSEPVLHDESVQSEQQEANTTVTVPPTTSTTTNQQHVIGSEEYFADDAAGSTSTTDVTSDADETTIVADKSRPTIATVVVAADDSQHSNTSTGMDETNPMTTITSSDNSRLAVSAVVAVGRALSQEESVPWPEAKSTKVIGTIIEDIHGPFSDGVSSVNGSSPDVLTSSGIAAIVMCSFLVLLTTAGASGYWWYRRRYLLNRPETLSERYAPSETGLGAGGDDIFRVGYVHSPELPRDSSEEMYSLDNDSFLTSLEAMTIPTYWTETIKHTKL